MIEVLRNPTYAKLFAAQVVALLGTGLLTVALGLLAFDIAGSDAGMVLGIALTIKMIAYVAVGPLIQAATYAVSRKLLLVSADVLRAGVALSLPLVTEAWHIYALIFVLQSASATFTPAFQAVIPDVLPDERQYTHALSLSRLAYDLESVASPAIAAALLGLLSYQNLFGGTFIGFFGSLCLVLATRFARVPSAERTSFAERLTLGIRVFWRDPSLRALVAMNLTVAAASAMVIVNTVVLVQSTLGRPQSDVALLLASFGAGSMLVAVAIPKILTSVPDRAVMLMGAHMLCWGLLAAGLVMVVYPGALGWAAFLMIWPVLGASVSMVATPAARLLRRGSDQTNRSAVFAAQFSLSHACFLLTYPAAGFLGAALGLPTAAFVLAVMATTAAIIAHLAWSPPHVDLPGSDTGH